MSESQFQDPESILTVFVSVALYMLVGGIISYFSAKRAQDAFRKANGRPPAEPVLAIHMACMMVSWPLMAPYVWGTKFRFWKQKVT